jgi:internalin A
MNQLTTLPESIGMLTRLRSLNLFKNQLTKLPESLIHLTSLKELYLHENKSLGVLSELIGTYRGIAPSSVQEVLGYYYFAQHSAHPLNEAKLILVGRGGSGKTSVVNRLVNDSFVSPKKTEGIKVTEWKVNLESNEEIRLNIWDFGGQEIMHATHQFFLTQRSLYLLVLSGREGSADTDAEYWLELIEGFGGDSPVIVVMNKIREQPFELNRRALQGKYPVIREFVKRTALIELVLIRY